MLDAHLTSLITRHRLWSGPAAGHIHGFAAWLHRQGYRPATLDATLRSLAGWTPTKGSSRSFLRLWAPPTDVLPASALRNRQCTILRADHAPVLVSSEACCAGAKP